MTETPNPEFYYRYTDGSQENQIDCIALPVIRHTSCGVWLNSSYFWKKNKEVTFVLSGVGKRFAYPSKELALASYRARKQRQIKFLAAQHDRARARLKAVERQSLVLDFAFDSGERVINKVEVYRIDDKIGLFS